MCCLYWIGDWKIVSNLNMCEIFFFQGQQRVWVLPCSWVTKTELSFLVKAPYPSDASFVDNAHMWVTNPKRGYFVWDGADSRGNQPVINQWPVTPEVQISIWSECHGVFSAGNLMDMSKAFNLNWLSHKRKFFPRKFLTKLTHAIVATSEYTSFPLGQKQWMRVSSRNLLQPTLNTNSLRRVINTFIFVDAEPAKLVAACCKCTAVDVEEKCMFCPTADLNDFLQSFALVRTVCAGWRLAYAKHSFAIETPSVCLTLFVDSCCVLSAASNLRYRAMEQVLDESW